MKHNRTLRRGLGVLLALVMCLSLLPATALAAEPATATADFTTNADGALALLNGAKTEGAADSEWDPYTSTLTLNGVNFTTTAETAVKLPDGATIVLAEGTTNTIASTNSSTNVFGIRCQGGSLNISGGGSLTINVSYTNSTMWYMAVGIYAGSVTMTGGTVNIVASNSKYSSYGVFASKDLSVTGGHLTANITTNQEMGYGLCCQAGEIDIGAAATVDVTVTNSGVAAMYGIYNRADTNGIADNGNINLAGTVTVKKGSSATGKVFGIANSGNGYNPNGVISVTGGSVTVTDAYCGISTATAGHTEAFSDVVISGGTVNITSSEALSRGIVSWKNGVSISGGAVTVSTVDPALALDDADNTNQTGLVNISGGAAVSLTSSDSKALVVQGDSSMDSTRTHQIDLASGGSVTIKSTSNTESNVLFPEQGYFILGSHTAITEGDFRTGDINKKGGQTFMSGTTSEQVVVAYQPSATPFATVSDATVSGNKGVAITDTDVTVTLLNDTFASTLSGSWITNLPAGLSQTVTRVDDTHATITISGTPTATRVAAMAITIPADQLTSNAALTVTANANAKFDIIVPVYPVTFDANGGTGTMTAVTTTGDYTLPTCTFTAPSGKQFKGWALTATGEVISGTSITVTEDTTLYAVWEDIPATTCDQTADFTIGDGSDALALLNGAKTEGAADSTWDSTNTILTLNGVDFTTSAATAVRLPDGAKIVLAEGTENTITSTYNGSGSGSSYGIYANGGLTIEGSGKLTATGGTAEYSSGIYAEDGNLTISDCTLTATGGTAENWSCGIEADGDADISSGTVTAKGGTAEVSIGIYAGDYLYISGGTVIAAGSDITGENSESYGIYVDNEDITISGEKTKVTVTGGTADSASYGIFTYSGYITIKGGTVTATGGTATGEGSDSYGIYADGAVTISGGTVTATGGEATGEESESYGICAYDDMDISGGTVTATGGNATGDASKSCGLYGRGYFENNEVIGGNITISGGTVKATGGNVDLYSDGIYADGVVTISGGTVTATGGEVTDEASESFGIESYNSETIIISGGHVTARTLTTTAWTKSALNKAPDLSGYSGYRWRTSASGDFTSSADTAYSHDNSYTYVEFSSQNTVTTYTVTVQNDGNGSGTATPATAAAGTEITLSASANSGYHFKEWQVVSGTVTITDNKFTMPASDVTVKAIFEEDAPETYTVTVQNDGNGSGTATPATAAAGTEITLSASANSGYHFKEWQVVSGTVTITGNKFTMPASDVTVKAIFEKNSSSSSSGGDVSTYAITVDSAKNGDVTTSHKTASKGTTVTLTVEPDKGFELDTLTVTDGSGKKVSVTEKSGKYTFTMPASKVTVKATFAEIVAEPENPFVDVADDAYYFDAVLWAAENGITGGVDDTHFAPNVTCTRAQAVTFLWRAAGSPAPKSSEMPFEDVAAGSYYYDAVLWAVENGITKGTSDTTFSPNADCTRAQIVTFLWRSQGSPVADAVNPFTDVAADAYYNSAVLWAVTNGITDGTSATTFSPAANCTRAQIVTFLFRCLG